MNPVESPLLAILGKWMHIVFRPRGIKCKVCIQSAARLIMIRLTIPTDNLVDFLVDYLVGLSLQEFFGRLQEVSFQKVLLVQPHYQAQIRIYAFALHLPRKPDLIQEASSYEEIPMPQFLDTKNGRVLQSEPAFKFRASKFLIIFACRLNGKCRLPKRLKVSIGSFFVENFRAENFLETSSEEQPVRNWQIGWSEVERGSCVHPAWSSESGNFLIVIFSFSAFSSLCQLGNAKESLPVQEAARLFEAAENFSVKSIRRPNHWTLPDRRSSTDANRRSRTILVPFSKNEPFRRWHPQCVESKTNTKPNMVA